MDSILEFFQSEFGLSERQLILYAFPIIITILASWYFAPKKPKLVSEPKEPSDEEEKISKPLPESIEFGTTLLLTPSLKELGVPKPFNIMGSIQCHVERGQWIEKNDLLLTYTFNYYDGKPLPNWLTILEKTIVHTVELRSPVYGFVVDLRAAYSRGAGSFNKPSYSAVSSRTYCADLLPTILLPKNEPAWDDYFLRWEFLQRVFNSIRDNWKQNIYNPGAGSYTKMTFQQAVKEGLVSLPSDDKYGNEIHSPFDVKDMDKAIDWIQLGTDKLSTLDNIRWKTMDYKNYLSSTIYRHTSGKSLDGYIEKYRNSDIILRHKLEHLIHQSSFKSEQSK
ncbi:hypothetical protein [Aquimarina macrocephali]|uniref:hypothetical protein n=1 Tax=Aquimarina macrocephali TaxID=666563 RepID=UPI0004677066|nr:hypothetical protein [Aquimarina macrocephali]